MLSSATGTWLQAHVISTVQNNVAPALASGLTYIPEIANALFWLTAFRHL